MKRKIVQISCGAGREEAVCTFALADDGTLWEGCHAYQGRDAYLKYKFEWKQLPELPGTEEIGDE
jgi:hypothetical protein